MHAGRIRRPDGTISWTVLDDEHRPIGAVRAWLDHLERIQMSPNTVSRFAKHVATLGTFLSARDKSFEQITIGDYDQFLAWLEHRRAHAVSPNIIRFQRAADEERPRISASLRNQIHNGSEVVLPPLGEQRPVRVCCASRNCGFMTADTRTSLS